MSNEVVYADHMWRKFYTLSAAEAGRLVKITKEDMTYYKTLMGPFAKYIL